MKFNVHALIPQIRIGNEYLTSEQAKRDDSDKHTFGCYHILPPMRKKSFFLRIFA